MIVRLKVLLDEPRGSAWPSSARTVRRTVKSVNERDPCPYLRTSRRLGEHYKGPLVMNQRKARATVGLYAPNLLGYTRHTMA